MAVKLYGAPVSTCTRRVITALLEKNVSYELIPINFATGEHKQPNHLARQPFGKVPVLEDNGLVVFESRAICKYIAKKYAGQGTKLIPTDNEVDAFALFEQACSIEQNYFNGPVEGIAVEKVFKLYHGGTTDEKLVEQYAEQLDKTLAVYDGILAKQKYLAGNEVTLADLFHLPYGKLVRDQGFKGTFEKYANVEKWFTGLEKRESWAQIV